MAPFSFAYPIDKIMHAFKYGGSVFWGPLLAETVARRALSQGAARPEALIPVPIHPRRLAERGFNQSLELARKIGHEMDLPVLTDAVARIGWHPPQVGLGAKLRRENARGAFALARRRPELRDVAIVDDILTTGATARELSRILLRSGVRGVQVWVVARTQAPVRSL